MTPEPVPQPEPEAPEALAPDPTVVLDAVNAPDHVKADAWDAFHSAAGPSHFQSMLDPLALPDEVKGALWDLKYGPGDDAAPAAEAAKPEPPPPIYNVEGYRKAHGTWNDATIKAAGQFLEDHPEVTDFNDAKDAVAGSVGMEPQIEHFRALAPPPKPVEPEAPAPEPKPAKPTKSATVGPDTPNPPTAALPTQPEAPATMAIQMQQLASGQRKAVMYPKGTPLPAYGTWPPGFSQATDAFGNQYMFNPQLTSRAAVQHAAKNNQLPELLGHSVLGMGAPDKTALQGPPVAVVAQAPDGTEAQSTVTDAPSLVKTLAAARAVTPPGGAVRIRPPQQVIRARRAATVLPPPLIGNPGLIR